MPLSGLPSRHRGRCRTHQLLVTACVTGLLSTVGFAPAEASVFDVFGMTARGTALGGAMGATATDHAAIYYNPAATTRRKTTHLGLTLQMVAPLLDISQARNTTRGAVLPEPNLALTLGAVFPLGGKIDDRVALGVALFLPVLNFTRFEALDPATPQFYLYQSLPDALVIAASLGVELIEGLSIGVGTQILASFAGELEVSVALGERRVERRTVSGDLFGEIAPTAGIWGEPFEGFTLGFTYRDDLSLDFELPVRIDIAELGALDIVANGRGLYTPEQFNFAAAYRIAPIDLLVALDVTWMRFSKAPSPALHIDGRLDDAGLRGGDGSSSSEVLIDLATVDPELGAADVVVPRLGLEWRQSDLLALQAGYFYRASPIPDQVGYSSYVDNAAHVASLGASLTWNDPLEVHDSPVTLDLFVQTTILQSRSVTKDPLRDLERIGDWTASGMIWNFGIEARHDL